MTIRQPLVRTIASLILPAALLAAGFAAAASPEGPSSVPHPAAPGAWRLETRPGVSLVTIDQGDDPFRQRSGLVVLPPSAETFELSVPGQPDARATALSDPMIMRGLRVMPVLVSGARPGPVTVEVKHDGRWTGPAEKQAVRLTSHSLQKSLGLVSPAGLKSGVEPGGGSYLIVHAPAFTGAIAPLVDWKTRKGLRVRTISTGVTGASSAGIKAYIQEAYDTWEYPPEFILLMGDVDEIPTYNFYGNPSDLEYVLLDGDDWLPDALLGRLPVENDTEARTVINKIVGYERTPYVEDGTDWFTRSIMVGGVEGSDTPPHTVRFCGEQLQKIGFAPAQTFLHPPLPSNAFIAQMFNPAMDAGASVVAYRGWAYGTSGWSDPRYEVNDMGGMNNAGKLPVVMSFVCLNGDYTASSPCFGEAFLRLGLPDEPRGAIAFIGNGEHWSHTRYNDAMAISVFERIIEPEINDLGSLLTAGKLRFMDFFPHEMEAADHGEESVEFYFHIYNLLGDPDLHFWKSTPDSISTEHAGTLVPGAGFLDVTVSGAHGGLAVAGATVSAVAGGQLLGTAVSDETGLARVVFEQPVTAGQVDITASGPGLIPHESILAVAAAGPALVADGLVWNDSGQGNGDGLANPGEVLDLTLTMRNSGTAASGPFSVSMSVAAGPATASETVLDFPSLAPGETTSQSGLQLSVAAAAGDGDAITCRFDAVRAGDAHDLSAAGLTVTGSRLDVLTLTGAGGNQVTPGGVHDLELSLQATGALGTDGGQIEMTMVPTPGVTLIGGTATFGPCQPGGTVTTVGGLQLQVDSSVATGTALTFTGTLTTGEGRTQSVSCATVIGPVDVTTVCGPDAYGYYAYDSADLDYPDSRPVYRWNEISPNLGGSGTELAFPVDNEIVNVQVDLPFTFPFYGQEYSRIRVSDNGWISFDLAPNFNFYNWPMPSQHGNNAKIAPYWENLVPTGDGGANGIAPDGIFYQHDPVAGTFTVQWSRLHHYKPQILGLQTFQVVLLDPALHPTASGDGEMLFFYRDVINNDYERQYATVGVESADGLDGLQLSYAGINQPGMAALQPGLAVRVTTAPPVRVPFTLTSFTARRDNGWVQLDWQPSDQRPVTGWHVDRIDPHGTVRLTDAPLPGAARSFRTADVDPSATADAFYSLTALHPYGGTSRPGETFPEADGALTSFALHRASPNPSTGSTSIAFALSEDAPARLRVYDAAGRLVRTLVDGPVTAGERVGHWDGRNDRGAAAAAGVYFFRLESQGRTLTRKMILVR